MDSLRYWTLYPEKVELSGLALVFLGRLERAGFVLEAGMLEAARNPGRVAETILSDLEALMLSQGSSETTAPRDPNVAYARYTPEIEQVLSHVDLNRAPSKFGKVAYLARMSRLQIDHLDSEGTNQMLTAYLAEVEMRLNEKDLAEEQLSSLGLMNLALCRASEKFFGESGFARINGDPSARPPVRKATSGQLLSRLSETQNALLHERADRAAARGPEAMQEVIDELLDFAQHMSNQKGVVEAYESIVDRFPESPYACRALLALGKHYEEEMKSPVLAVKAYRRVVTAFPKTSEAVEAQLRSMISLCQSQEYAEAYAVAQEFLIDPPQEKIPIAKMISALSEAGLGLADDAKAHMEQIVEKYPQSDLAPRCLLWLGSEALGRQSYAEALRIFQDLSERYPESSYAKQAREYMGRLAKVAGSQ